MITDLLHHETLSVLVVTEAVLPDSAGEVVATTTEQPWGPCNVQRKSSSESQQRGEETVIRLRVSGPLALWITSAEKIIRRGITYYVEGEPAHFEGGVLDHTEVDLVTWKGAR
ncbi:hypothetical protein V5R04_15595 [Jonesiaceae bacterium BS-20]|uniref:Head-tail adaptor protein n=1 Tax=Jonesiaceae bacterium BS-20 TaxID=3120821 RepID=A0AAU7DW98_9MICO